MTYSKVMLKIKTNPQTHSQIILEGAHLRGIAQICTFFFFYVYVNILTPRNYVIHNFTWLVSNTMFILLVFTQGVTLAKTHQWVRSTWFVWMHRRVWFLTEVSPGLMCFSVKSLEVLCKTVVGEVLSVGKADCLGNFFFSSHTLAIT